MQPIYRSVFLGLALFVWVGVSTASLADGVTNKPASRASAVSPPSHTPAQPQSRGETSLSTSGEGTISQMTLNPDDIKAGQARLKAELRQNNEKIQSLKMGQSQRVYPGQQLFNGIYPGWKITLL